MTDFTHLHVHTEFSLLDGVARLKDLIARAKELNMHSLAVTDHGVMYAAVDFYSAAKEAGIKPIIGCEVYVAPNTRHDRASKADGSPHHLVLLAKDRVGYRNLIQLASKAQLEGFYYKPRVDKELLAQYSEGLIALSACLSGEIPRLILNGDLDGARKSILWHRDTFGADNYYLELQGHDIPELKTVNAAIKELSKELGVPLVATNDVHYVYQKDSRAQEILLCIQTNTTLDDPKRMAMHGDSFYLRSQEEMAELFTDVPEAISNTALIAERCNFEFDFGRVNLPQFPIPEGYTPDTWLEKLSRDGMKKRYPRVTDEIEERLRYELDVVEQTGFALYILIVADLVYHARANDIHFGPRGSAAGSIICYCLGIGDVEPLENKLVFERFLNIERKEMPDIDMDFADERRGEMIEYCTQKYGRDHVAQIITFGTLGAKNALRDVGRVLGMTYGVVDNVAKMIPALPVGITIEKAMAERNDLKELYESDPSIKQLIDDARSVEGVSRHASMHAAGVVISRDPLADHVPLQRGSRSDDSVMCQYTMTALAKIGLLKMDFLGLANLTILGKAVDIVRQTRGIEIDLLRIPLDDEKVFDMLARGETTGIFQLEGAGMRKNIQELKPNSIGDLAAMIALYRPGPMAHIPRFIRSKFGLDPIEYPHPALEPILGDTYGVIVYQEQVLFMVREIAGYSLGQADIFRKAMSKKNPEVMKKQRVNFIESSVKKGFSEKDANAIFDMIEPFAGYAFNRAHAYCYAMVAYRTGYLKANFTEEYMVAVLSAASSTTEKIAVAIAECKRLGIEILRPDINKSEPGFSIETNHHKRAIRFGMAAIKNAGVGAIEAIVAERKANGPFSSIDDLAQRFDTHAVNKRVIESLIKAGALDDFGRRSQLLEVLDKIVNYGQQSQKAAETGQCSMFDLISDDSVSAAIELPNVPDLPNKQLLTMEKELLGAYISDHPMQQAFFQIEDQVTAFCDQINEELVGQTIIVGGMITSLRKLVTKKGDNMAIATVEDLQGSADIVAFPKVFEKTQAAWAEDNIVIIEGKVEAREDRVQIVCQKATVFNQDEAPAPKPVAAATAEAPANEPKRPARNGGSAVPCNLRLTMRRSGNDDEDLLTLDKICEILDKFNGGSDQVELYVAANGHQAVELILPQKVRFNPQMRSRLIEILGEGSIEITDRPAEPQASPS